MKMKHHCCPVNCEGHGLASFNNDLTRIDAGASQHGRFYGASLLKLASTLSRMAVNEVKVCSTSALSRFARQLTRQQ